MKSWPAISLPVVAKPPKPLTIFSTQVNEFVEFELKNRYQMYVCGITPYDATHLGHAATYLTFDLIHRYWLAQGATVNYIQNITDIDDPLLERAQRDGVNWQDLADSQIDLFRTDMELLRILPPSHYESAVEAIPEVIAAISRLDSKGAVYSVEADKYFSVDSDSQFGHTSNLQESEMFKLFAERGGDPERSGKKHPLDTILWLSHREGEPYWSSIYGDGRPGWHIECAAIALKFAEANHDYIIDMQGGGKDLIFPHHEMSSSQVKVLTGKNFARTYVHAALIGLDGEKMSKSKGNLILVSKLIESGVSPMAIRWALLKRPYDQEYMWQRNETEIAKRELDALAQKLIATEVPPTANLVRNIYDLLGDNLKSAQVISAINDWVASNGTGGDPQALREVIDALLGIILPK